MKPVEHGASGSVPVPDPTILTTKAVDRGISHLRELYDLRFEQLDLRLEQRFQAQSKALDAALMSADLKSDALADKIGQMAVDMKTLITRAEYETQHRGLIDKIDETRARYYEQSGMTAGSNVTQQLRDLVAQVESLRQSRDAGSGRALGLTQGWLILIGAVGLVATILAIYRP